MKEVSDKEFECVSQIYKLLSDVTRLKILLLLEDGELNVTAIATHLAMEQSAVSHQLKLLRENQIVKNRREGKTILYSLDDGHVLAILTKTFDHVRHN
jgi:DNA-binding transcriptional ArsR family regulator